MTDETLRMNAVVTDGFTSPLQSLNKLLAQVGMNPAGKQVAKDWEGVGARINKVALEIKNGLQPVMAGLGVASLGVSGAIAGIGLAVKNFAFNTRDLSLFSKNIGLSVDQLRQLKAVGERFGIDWNQAQGSLKQFAGNMDQLQRRWGQAYGQLRAMDLGDLAENLVSAPNMQAALDRALEGIKSIQNPVRRREIAQLLFGSDQWATVASGLTPSLRAEIKKLVGEITPEMKEASEKFVKNWFNMQQAIDGFVVQGIGPAIEPINDLINLLSKPVGEGLTHFFKKFNEAVKEFTGGNILNGLKALDQALPGPIEFGTKGTLPDLQTQLQMAEQKQRQALDRGDGVGAISLGHEIRALREAIDRLRREGSATVQQQSFDGGGGGVAGMIQRAAWGGGSGGGGGSPFSAGFWSNVYRGGVGGDPFRGAGRTWDQAGVGGGSRGGQSGPSGTSEPGGGAGRFSGARPPEAPGRYRPPYKISDADLDQRVVNTVAGEVSARNAEGVDAVINNMLNRVGSKGWGPSRNLLEVARARGQYEGYRQVNPIESEFIRSRIRAIATGGVPDNTGGANSYRSGWYNGPWRRRAGRDGIVIGGNRFAYDPTIPNGPYAPYAVPRKQAGAEPSSDGPRADGPRNPAGWRTDREMQEATGVRRSGDSMMGRAFGAGGVAAGAPKLSASGSVNITLSGGLEKMPARVSMDGLFKDVQVNRKVKVSNKRQED